MLLNFLFATSTIVYTTDDSSFIEFMSAKWLECNNGSIEEESKFRGLFMHAKNSLEFNFDLALDEFLQIKQDRLLQLLESNFEFISVNNIQEALTYLNDINFIILTYNLIESSYNNEILKV